MLHPSMVTGKSRRREIISQRALRHRPRTSSLEFNPESHCNTLDGTLSGSEKRGLGKIFGFIVWVARGESSRYITSELDQLGK